MYVKEQNSVLAGLVKVVIILVVLMAKGLYKLFRQITSK